MSKQNVLLLFDGIPWMKIGDLVFCWPLGPPGMSHKASGVIVGFNKKGEGGKEFVHVLCEGVVLVFMDFDVEVINESR